MVSGKIYKASRWILLFFALSFLGWTMETIWCSYLVGHFWNRGFLHLPFCTIYGFGILAIYFLIGTPKEGGWMLKKLKNGVLRWIVYYLMAALIPTVAEIITGAFFDHVLGVELWSYAAYRFNLWGYVSLEISLLWGVLATAFMALIFMPLKRTVEKVPYQISLAIAVALAVVTCIDWCVCFAHVPYIAH